MSPLVTQKIPPMIGGVSQLPPELRGAGQLSEAVNTFPSDTLGLGVRSPTQTVAALGTPSVSGEHAVDYAPAPGERYLFRVTSVGISVIDIVTGQVRSVATTGDLTSFLATGQFTSSVVGGTVYVASKGYSKAQWTSKLSPAQASAVLVDVKQGAESSLYKLTIDGITVSVRTPDDPPKQRLSVGLVVNAAAEAVLDVSMSPPSVSVTAGTTTSVAVNVTRPTGYSGAISLSATAPSGYNVTFNSTVLSGSTATTIMYVTPPSYASSGMVSVAVAASTSTGQLATSSLAVSVTALSGGGGGGGGSSYTLDSAPVSVVSGASSSTAIHVTRIGGYTNAVTLSVLSAPTGITGTFGTNPVASNTNASLLTLSVDGAVADGTYTVFVQGTDVASNTVTLPITVTVGASGSIATLAVANSPTSVSLAQGFAQDVSIDITRGGGFTGAVSGTTTYVPAGFTATFNGPFLGSSVTHTTLHIVVGPSVTPGSYVVGYIMQGTGVSATGSISIDVTASSATGIAWSPSNTTTINAGAFNDGNVNLTVERLGFYSGDVTLTVVSTSDTLLTAVFDPTPLTGLNESTNLAFEFDSDAGAGTYTIYLKASGSGVADAFCPVTITRS